MVSLGNVPMGLPDVGRRLLGTMIAGWTGRLTP